jgi:hypothetical protein
MYKGKEGVKKAVPFIQEYRLLLDVFSNHFRKKGLEIR